MNYATLGLRSWRSASAVVSTHEGSSSAPEAWAMPGAWHQSYNMLELVHFFIFYGQISPHLSFLLAQPVRTQLLSCYSLVFSKKHLSLWFFLGNKVVRSNSTGCWTLRNNRVPLMTMALLKTGGKAGSWADRDYQIPQCLLLFASLQKYQKLLVV